MTFLSKLNRTLGAQTTLPTSIQEGPIRNIPAEVLVSILFVTNQNQNTRLVSKLWNVLTLNAVKQPTKQELTQTIQLIIKELNPNKHAKCKADLAEIQAARQPRSAYVAAHVAVGQLFLAVKGSVVGVIRKLPVEERDQLQIAIGDQLPDSMKDLFKISKLNFMPSITDFFNCSKPKFVGKDIFEVSELAPENIDLDTFFTLLQSHQPLTIIMRTQAVLAAVKRNNIGCLKLLLPNGPITEVGRGDAVVFAVCRENIESVKLLLGNGPISEAHRGSAVCRATEIDNIEFARLLLSNGQISEEHRGLALCGAAGKGNKEFVKSLLANGSISEEHRREAADNTNDQELLQLLTKG